MIIVAGTLRTDPSRVHEVHAALLAGVEPSLREDGCLFYQFGLVDAGKGQIVACERWRDEAALRAHLETPHIAEFIERYGGLLEVDVSLYDATNERPIYA